MGLTLHCCVVVPSALCDTYIYICYIYVASYMYVYTYVPLIFSCFPSLMIGMRRTHTSHLGTGPQVPKQRRLGAQARLAAGASGSGRRGPGQDGCGRSVHPQAGYRDELEAEDGMDKD